MFNIYKISRNLWWKVVKIWKNHLKIYFWNCKFLEWTPSLEHTLNIDTQLWSEGDLTRELQVSDSSQSSTMLFPSTQGLSLWQQRTQPSPSGTGPVRRRRRSWKSKRWRRGRPTLLRRSLKIWGAGKISGRLFLSGKETGYDPVWHHLCFCRGQIGEDGEVFEKVCETDCEGVHTNIHYSVQKEGEFRMKLRNWLWKVGWNLPLSYFK